MKYSNNQKERKKSEKKIKKMRERTDVYGCTGVRGGEGHSAFMVVLPVLYYNGLQRSFDSLQTALVRVIQGKDENKRV